MQTISITSKEKLEAVSIENGKHIIGEFIGDENGASIIVFGGVHGNEQSAVIAMRRMLPKLEALKDVLNGRVYFLAGNTRAINKNARHIDYDLNRQWTLENVERNKPNSSISTNKSEDIEQTEILTILEEILSTAKNEIYGMDLHSTSAESIPFALIGDTLRNREFAMKFPATFLLGIEEQLDGTLTEYLNNLGLITLGFEAGQHTNKLTVDSQEALIWLALVHSQILSEEEVNVAKHESILRNAMNNKKRIVEIRYRHKITESDKFKMELGYENFQPVRKGEVLAKDKDGDVLARDKSLILMPLYQTQGSDGFFLGGEVSAFWLSLSRVMRKLKLGDLMRFLPGVQQHPVNEETLIVNLRVAKIFPLQIFHLLGFRKLRRRDDKLIVSRRKYDLKSPWIKA